MITKNKLLAVLFILIGIVFGFLIGYFFNNSITGKAIEQISENYTWTTAVCDDNKCIDVLIECRDGRIISIKPISDLVEFPEYWRDPRENLTGYCR